MVFDLIIGFLAGLTGLLPFLHVNLLLSLFDFESALFVSALGFSSVVFSFIPSVFFALPGEGMGVSVLASNELAVNGMGLKAIRILCLSFFLGLVASILLYPVFVFILPIVVVLIKPFVGVLLLLVVCVFFFVSGFSRMSFFVFILSGVLGLGVFIFPVVRDPLFPLLSGLFGLPALIFSFNAKKPVLVVARGGFAGIDFKLVIFGTVLGCFSVLLPALSPAFLAAFAFLFLENSSEAFLSLTGAIVASKTFYDIVSAFVLHKARSGFAGFFLESSVGLETVLAAGIFASCLAVLLVLFFGRHLAFFFDNKIKLLILCLVVAGVFAVNGFVGLFVLSVALLVGLLPLLYGFSRGSLVGSLIIPSLVYSFGLAGVFLI